eukprot:PITA_35128
MNEEYNSIMKNDTWELTKLPKDKVPIGCKWLFKPKFNVDGSIDKYKARLVSKGYSHEEGIDYKDTFVPVAKINTIRIMIELATKQNWKMHQLDVKSVFLNGELKVEVYLVQPEGFLKKGEEHLVFRLKKALYGLKQAPRSWYVKIDSFFYGKGFVRSKSDPKLYIKRDEDGNIALISFYVDDLIITDSALTLIEEIKIKLSQNAKLYNDGGSKEVNGTLYRQLVGSLNYLTTTRQDIAYSVSILSQFMAKPRESNWKVAKKVLRYLKGTLYFGILYTDEYDVELASFSDSDWVGNPDDRRSTS